MPEELESIRLYARLLSGSSEGLLDDSSRIAHVLDRVRGGMEASLKNPDRQRGLHTQAMFAQVIKALDHCLLLKEEDSGQLWAKEEVAPPDFRVVTPEGQNLFIEVKHFFGRTSNEAFRLRTKMASRLQRYSDLAGAPLLIAVYWAHLGWWTLVDTERFEAKGASLRIDLEHAMAENQMWRLGDCMIGTLPPLEMRLVIDPPVARRYGPEEEYEVTIVRQEMSCGGRKLTRPREQALARFLMLHGTWVDDSQPEFEGDMLVAMKIIATPEVPDPGHDHAIVGFLSQFYSRAYWLSTSTSGEIRDLSKEITPEFLGSAFGQGYRSPGLPLWRMILHPKSEDRAGGTLVSPVD